MELEGLEPSTYRLPADRSSQLSYSPVELVVRREFIAASCQSLRRGSNLLATRGVLGAKGAPKSHLAGLMRQRAERTRISLGSRS